MFDKLDATIYRDSGAFYTNNFEVLLSKITDCYLLMKLQELILENDENKIRDVLLLRYLKNDEVRKQLQLLHWHFEREVPEDYSVGRTDIKVVSLNTFKKQEDYYIVECKRLDNVNTTGATGLNAKYVQNGISRFTEKYYSSYRRVNAMIGFVVEKMNIHLNTKKINKLLKTFAASTTIKYITKDNFIEKFEYQYHSTHSDSDGEKLKIYHLMFEFSENISTHQIVN